MSQEQTPQRAYRSPWVIAWVFIVLAVLGVNIFMAIKARQSNPGLVADDYYDRGQKYEDSFLSRRSSPQGWAFDLAMPKEGILGETIQVACDLRMETNAPLVTPESVTVYLYRPSGKQWDFNHSLKPERPDHYVAQFSFPLKGVWDLLLVVKYQGEEYTLGRRVIVRDPAIAGG